MPTTELRIARWSWDLDGNPLGYINETGAPETILPVYVNDGGPVLTATFPVDEAIGRYDFGYARAGSSGRPQQIVQILNGFTPDSRLAKFWDYDPYYASGGPELDALAGYAQFDGGYWYHSPPDAFYLLPRIENVVGQSSTPGNIGRWNTFGEASYTFEIRQLAITNFRTERPVVDIQSRNPLVKIRGDITVYPNQQSNGIAGWKPQNKISYRIKLKSPLFANGEYNLDGEIPIGQISEPSSTGVVASFEHTWDGSVLGLPLRCEMPIDIEARAITDVEIGNTLAVSSGIRVLLYNCRGKRFQKQASFQEGIPLLSGDGASINPVLNYRSFESTEVPASMGYGWSCTDNIKVYEIEDQSLSYFDGSGWLRWMKSGSAYEPLMPDNKLSVVKDSTSSTARYVITWRDGSRREFGSDGSLRKDVDVNGRAVSYEKFASYLKITDDNGRSVYQHYPPGGLQPSVINDNANPEQGRIYKLEYYGSSDPAPNRLKRITDPANQQTLFVYNAAGRITERREVRPSEGDRSVFYSYTAGPLFRLAAERTASRRNGVLTNHAQIAYGYLVEVPGKPGFTATRSVTVDLEANPYNPLTDKVVYQAHDAHSRLIAEFELLKIEGSGQAEVRTYLETYHFYEDPNNPYSVTKTIAPNGAITQWQYTARGNVKKVIDAQGNETVYSYVEEDPSHLAYATFPDLVTQVRRPAPDQDTAPTVFYPPTKFVYNPSNGDLLSVEDAQGKLTYLRYNSIGKVDRVIDRLGFKTYMKYDVKARLSELHVQKSLDPSPSVEELVDEDAADFRAMVLSYDSYDNVTEVLDSNGNSISTTYDAVDRPLTVTDGNDVDTVFSYVDRVLKQVTLPDNNAPSSNVRLAKLEYDAAGRTTAVKRQDSSNAAQLRVGFAYNGFSQLKALKRLKNGVEKSHTVDSWDRQGRPLQTTDANGNSSTSAYEPYCVGQASTSARGVRMKTSFDTLCRLTKVEAGSPHATNPLEMGKVRETRDFQYDDLGRPTKTLQRPPARYGQAQFGQSRYGGLTEERSWEYDSLDRLKKVTFEDGKTMEYEHDFEGNVTKITENASGTPKVTEFSYFGDGKLYQVTYVRSGGNQVFTYSYDPGGRPLTLTYPSSTGIVAHFTGPSDEVGWDGNGQLLHLRYVKDETTLIRRFAFGYDPAGNRITQLDVAPTKAISWAYGYDWLDRLETVKKAEAADVASLGALQLVSVYEYDAADNRIKFEVPNLSNPALTETYRSSYDFADNITLLEKKVGSGSYAALETFTSDFDGNLKTRVSGGVTTTYVWDDFNRLAAISTSDGSKKQTNTFGVSGFRRKKKDKDGVETTEYAAGLATAVSKATAGDTITYLMGHQIMGFERASDGAMFYFLTDALGSVRDIVSGTDGAVLQSYDYTENGDKTASTSLKSDKTWIGGLSVNDDVGDSGLYLMGHRHYDPTTQRFLSRDPIGFAGGLNLYSYAGNRPNQVTDAIGLWGPHEDEESERLYKMVAESGDPGQFLAVSAMAVLGPAAIGEGIGLGSTYIPMGYRLGLGGSATYFMRWLSGRPDVQEDIAATIGGAPPGVSLSPLAQRLKGSSKPIEVGPCDFPDLPIQRLEGTLSLKNATIELKLDQLNRDFSKPMGPGITRTIMNRLVGVADEVGANIVRKRSELVSDFSRKSNARIAEGANWSMYTQGFDDILEWVRSK